MVYSNHMSETTKTTVYLDTDAYRHLKRLARRQGRPAAELVREAVAEYAAKHGARRRPASIGSVSTGLGDLSENTERYLDGFGRS
ncbi:MAG: CopG family ribbon-helix-helix protein [Gemmatimonadota bacterium]